MRNVDELIDLRAERLELLQQLNTSSNSKRQMINKKLMRVSKKIQKLSGIALVSTSKEEI
ncbi:MAG: hypothetical protein U1D30_24705 [Planctomycetota bacterium]